MLGSCLSQVITYPSPFGLDSLLAGSSAALVPLPTGRSLAMPLLFMPFMLAALFRLGFYKK